MNRRRFVAAAIGPAAGLTAGASPASASRDAAALRQRREPSAGTARVGRAPRGKQVLFLAVDGMDAAMVGRFRQYLPNMNRMIREGYSGRVLPYVSCWGNMDFMSMLTGAPPGTQYRSRLRSGRQPSHENCVAETIWQALESEGRRSFLLEFRGGIPSRQVAGIPGPQGGPVVSGGTVYQTGNVVIKNVYREGLETTGWPPGGGPRPGRRSTVIADPKPASGWSSLPASRRPPLEIMLSDEDGGGASGWPALIIANRDAGYDAVIVFREKNGPELVRLQAGAWSPWVRSRVPSRSGPREAACRFFLLEVAPGGERIQILGSAGCALEHFSDPDDLSASLVKKLGPFWTGSAIPPTPTDPFWEVGEAEALEGAMWVAEAAIQSIDLWNWDFFIHKSSLVDSALHQCLTLADPFYYRYDPEIAKAADLVYRQTYMDLDKVVGRLLEAVSARGDTVLVVASDHGGGVNNTVCDVNQRLRDAGLLAGTDRQIDWSRTRAYTKRNRQGTEIYINVKGREPSGIVSPEDYESAQEAVIDALLDWREPRHNKRAVAYALKLRDAALLGYWGDEAGDVQFCYNPGFVWGVNPDRAAIAPSLSPVANHGPQIVTASTGYSSMMGQLLAWGPSVSRGVVREEAALGPIPIASVAPTLSHLLGCRCPRQCQLGPIQEMLV